MCVCSTGGGGSLDVAASARANVRIRKPVATPVGFGRRGQGKMTLATAAAVLYLLCFLQGSSSQQHTPQRQQRQQRHDGGGHQFSSTARAAWATPRLVKSGWLSGTRRGSVRQQQACRTRLPRAAVGRQRTALSMKARGKRGRAAGGAGGGATATAVGRGGGGGRGAKQKKKNKALYIQIEDLESDSWRCDE